MKHAEIDEAQAALEHFAETMFRLMVEHHQKHAVELDLTVSQSHALKALHRGPLCTTELALELKISAPAVTQLTNRLTRKRLIERRSADNDRRSVLVALTDRGKQAVERFRERRNTIFCGALEYLAEEDRANVIVALSKMIGALEKLDAGASVDNSASGLQKKIVYEEDEERLAIDGRDSQTAVLPLPASNDSSRAKSGQGARRMKMEWD
jgi:DNA-binding MarR family transcriptional regulator